MQGIYSVFLFSDVSEYELFVGKILTEESIVDSWVVVESEYSFKGRRKILNLRELIKKDKRMEMYQNRVHVIENTRNILNEVSVSYRERLFYEMEKVSRQFARKNTQLFIRKFKERSFFQVERISRDLATEVLLEVSGGKGWAFISDVDEFLDISGSEARTVLYSALKRGNRFITIRRHRFVFDFDNFDPQFRTCPIVDISLFTKKSGMTISEFRERQDGIFSQEVAPVKEFSYCLSLQGILIKLQDFAHVAPPENQVHRSLYLNHHLRYPEDDIKNIKWLQKIPFRDTTHPKYVLENAQLLVTGIVNQNYEEVRKAEMPHLFGSHTFA